MWLRCGSTRVQEAVRQARARDSDAEESGTDRVATYSSEGEEEEEGEGGEISKMVRERMRWESEGAVQGCGDQSGAGDEWCTSQTDISMRIGCSYRARIRPIIECCVQRGHGCIECSIHSST